MTSEIGSNDMKPVPQSLCDPVLIMTVISIPMHK